MDRVAFSGVCGVWVTGDGCNGCRQTGRERRWAGRLNTGEIIITRREGKGERRERERKVERVCGQPRVKSPVPVLETR